MTSSTDHVDVAAYVLGILDEDEVDAFENHLAQCRRCALDLRDFAVLPDLLDEADANGVLRAHAGERPDGRSVRAMLDVVSADRSRRRRHLASGVAAAAAVLVAVTAFVTLTIAGPVDDLAVPTTVPSPSGVANNLTAAGSQLHRTDPGTGVEGRIAGVPETWGTSVQLEVRGVRGRTRCELLVTSTSGESLVMGSWLAPDARSPITFHAGTFLRWHEIAEFTIRDAAGTTLVSLPL
ncbi:zf-HC2 domain-containing protein [Saccharothrix violaceirubra]|uniref:Putative zinc-finger domain-containing protein n=1 Tax=Saccharothrix violaceirubra TaxID=413306 RepID=A0A7W7T1G7_9PSEU|nr:zf-HC2 domain-containing protein [Saccharothrix violaceirubra]MBB4964794.1 hypothetical protein [Saccharothrix violaceirubra]